MNEARVNLAAGKQVTSNVHLIRPLGKGGMGAVWIADHTGLKTRVVVKFMLEELDASTSARSRFSREAAAAAQVKSPHVVQMLDHGVSEDGVPFIVMEHLEGRDLAAWIEERGALEPADVITIVTQVAKALSKVHAAGLLHRDIKPDNIFLCEGEEEIFVKLLDFGIAKSESGERDSTLSGETKTGQIVGTPFYMSPEQVTAQKTIDARSDVWSLGVVAFEALTGKKPFDGPSFGALAVKIATGAVPKPSEVHPALPLSVDAWFAKACAREPSQRFSSAKALAEGLRAAFEGVVSLPPLVSSSKMGDSGPRARLDSDATSGIPSGSGSGDARPSFVLASTIQSDDQSGERSVESSPARRGMSRSTGLAIIVVAAIAGLGLAGFVVARQGTQASQGTSPTPSATVRQSSGARTAKEIPSVVPSTKPRASMSAASPSSDLADVQVSAAVSDAAVAPPPASTHAPNHPPRGNPTTNGTPKPGEPKPGEPKPKPANTNDDPLY